MQPEVMILDLLKEKDLTAGEIAEDFDISKPSIYIIGYFKASTFSFNAKEGQFIKYS